MPWILYRYILADLLRVFTLTAAVLVLVVAFGAAIKPLAADDLVGPLQTAKYILLAIVPMLQFALPFAAGFAATVVMHRMTGDNEILAACASGISYRRILLPIAGIGLALLVIMVLLTQWIIPRFWAAMEQIIARDVARMVQSSVDKGLPVKFGDMQIHADRLMVQESPPDTGAETRLILLRVAAAELDREGRIVTDVTARQAVIDVYRVSGDTVLKMALVDTVGFDGTRLVWTPNLQPRPIVIPGAFRDQPMLMTQSQLLWMRDHPDDFSNVVNAKRKLAEVLRQRDVREHIDRQIRSTGAVELTVRWGGVGRKVEVAADSFSGTAFTSADGRPVVVTDLQGGRAIHRFSARTAEIHPALGSTLTDPTVDLTLRDCRVEDPAAGGVVNQREELSYPELSIDELAGEDPSTLPYTALLAEAKARDAQESGQAVYLAAAVAELNRDISGRLQKRYALSLTAMLLLVLGAALAMWLRHSVPLVIYIWAFLPSILDIMLISSGTHMIRSGLVPSGVALMWSGNLILLGLLAYVYRRLARN